MTINFIHPAKGSKLTSPFGYRNIGAGKEFHYGVDYAKTGIVPIVASADGTVNDTWPATKSTYGNVVFLTHNINGKRYDTVYAHLKTLIVKKGTKVKQGEIIGYMGNTGRSTGQHLHFEVHEGAWKTGRPNAVDPLKYVDVEDKKVVSKKKVLYLPPITTSWSVYPLDKAPVKKNAIAKLNPKKFNGLSYEILGNPQTDVYTIQTQQFGKVNIYAAKSTGAEFK